MNGLYLFEFMDQDWVPKSLRNTLRDILECGNSKPFRPYYSWAAKEIDQTARDNQITKIIELGSGTAPLSKHLACRDLPDNVKLVPTDLNPDRAAYEMLAKQYPDKIEPIYTPVDFSKSQNWGKESLLVLSGAFHHIPIPLRSRVLDSLSKSGGRVMILEPLRHNWASFFFVFGSLVPALLMPLWYLGRQPENLRRFFWCWLVPVAPLMFCWDGLVSVMRCWTTNKWNQALKPIVEEKREIKSKSSLFCTLITW